MGSLSAREKYFYAAGGLGAEALNQSRNAWLVFFYAPPDDADQRAFLQLSLVTVLLFSARLIESFDDIFIGWWSDRTESRWGRRIPFVVGAAPLWAFFAILLFSPPATSSTGIVAIYFVATLLLFHLFSTLAQGPYESLLPEIAPGVQERVNLSGLRVYFGIGGAALGLIGSGILVDRFGFQVMAAVMAGLALVTRYVGIAGVWRRARRSRPSGKLAFRESLRSTLSNRPFLIFLPTFVLFQVGLGMLIGLLPYYVVAILQYPDTGTWAAILTATAIVAMAVALPFFIRLANAGGPSHAYRKAMLFSAAAFPILALPGLIAVGPVVVQAMVALAIVGAPVAGVYLFPAPLMALICDHDTEQTGHHREATFFGTQAFVEKTVGALAPLFLGSVLLLGNTAENPLGVRLVGPVAGIVVLTGFLVFRGFDEAMGPRPLDAPESHLEPAPPAEATTNPDD